MERIATAIEKELLSAGESIEWDALQGVTATQRAATPSTQISWRTNLFWRETICHIDLLDTITSDRTYRKESAFEQEYDETVKMSGIQFNRAGNTGFLGGETALRDMVEAKRMRLHDPAIASNTNERSEP